MDQSHSDFHIAEYNGLRENFLSHGKLEFQSIIYVSISNAFIFSWLSTQIDTTTNRPILLIICWVPLLITLTGFALNYSRKLSMRRIGKYAMILEERFGENNLGWEQFVKKNPKKITTSNILNFAFVFQTVLTLFFGILFTSQLFST